MIYVYDKQAITRLAAIQSLNSDGQRILSQKKNSCEMSVIQILYLQRSSVFEFRTSEAKRFKTKSADYYADWVQRPILGSKGRASMLLGALEILSDKELGQSLNCYQIKSANYGVHSMSILWP